MSDFPSDAGTHRPADPNPAPHSAPIWPYRTPGIPDDLFERLPGIPMTKREIRVLILAHLRLKPNAVLWDIGAGTGTIPIEVGLLCPQATIVAVERDEDVASLIRKNCQRFEVNNVEVIEGSAPDCLKSLKPEPDCIIIEGGRPLKDTLAEAWAHLQTGGRLVATTTSLEGLYAISESLSELHARNIEVVQSAINRLEQRGIRQSFSAVNPIFILSGEKLG
jgi:cobalt-precorrin-6B (C15)-methyltransferase